MPDTMQTPPRPPARRGSSYGSPGGPSGPPIEIDADDELSSLFTKSVSLTSSYLESFQVYWKDASVNKRLTSFFLLPSGKCNVTAQVVPGGKTIEIKYSVCDAFVSPEVVPEDFRNAFSEQLRKNPMPSLCV
jgi:hypothetical protein